jgi:hypothetical protein
LVQYDIIVSRRSLKVTIYNETVETTKAWKSIPSERIALKGVKFAPNAVLPGLYANTDNPEINPPLFLDQDLKGNENERAIEFPDSFVGHIPPEVGVSLAWLLDSPDTARMLSLNIWIQENAKLEIERSFEESDLVEVTATIGNFVTTMTCGISQLAAFISQEPETEEENNARGEEVLKRAGVV